ncbi:MAG: type II secretion system protein [Planctomycetaceae bacterium]
MKTKHNRSQRNARRAFTLVEMLVAVTLVLLMMTMFASIFQMASGSVTKQRAIANHDQRARALSTLIRADFAHRTFRFPQPFLPGEDSATSITPFGERAGYIYISTNNPYSSLDDMVQFTVSSDILSEDPDNTPYSGRASLLQDRADGTANSLAINTNQPESDDGSSVINSTGGSNAAEICYIVRNGNLYRKVMLLRRPLPVAGKDLDEQPTTVLGKNFFANPADGLYSAYPLGVTNDFWLDFDYSAIPQNYSANNTVPQALPRQSAKFVGSSGLTNELSSSGAATVSLGNPLNRFGFNPVPGSPVAGLSREHTWNIPDTTLPAGQQGPFFLGRFIHSETSATNFNWPQARSEVFGSTNLLWSGNSAPGNPLDVRNPVTLNTTTGVVDEFSEGARGGIRRMEDLVLSNVHEFKVEVWDERLQRYTVPGHSEVVQAPFVDSSNKRPFIAGDFHRDRILPSINTKFDTSADFGPLGSAIGVFDTWHPSIDRLGNGNPDQPLYYPLRYYPPIAPAGPSRQLNTTAMDPATNGPFAVPLINDVDRVTKTVGENRGFWTPNTQYFPGEIVFLRWADNGDGLFEYKELSDPGIGLARVYRVRAVQGSGMSASSPPPFPEGPGKIVQEINREIEWECVDNLRPLSSIRLTVRFLDPQSESLRQLTLVIPLIDRE